MHPQRINKFLRVYSGAEIKARVLWSSPTVQSTLCPCERLFLPTALPHLLWGCSQRWPRTSPGTWPSSISTKIQEAAPEQDPGFGATLLFSVRQSRTHLPSVWNLPSVRAGASHSGTSSMSKSTSHQRQPGFKSTEGTDTAREWKSFFHPAGTQPHTYSALCHQLQNCQQRASKSLQLSHEYCSLQRGHFSPPPDFEWKDVSAVKNRVQQYLLWSFLSAALISNTRSRSHFCWTSLSIFFRKSTFAVPLRSCWREKGGEVWLNRIRNDRTVTYHRPLLISLGKDIQCSRALQWHLSAQQMTLPACILRSILPKPGPRSVRKVLTTVFHGKGLYSSQDTHTLPISPIQNKLRKVWTGEVEESTRH